MFQRSLKAVLTMLAVLIFVFAGSRLTGDPFSLMYGDTLTPEEISLYKEMHGLDKPILVQLRIYLSYALQGDFGKSFIENLPVTQIVFKAAVESIKLGIWAFILSLAAGVSIGIASAIKPHSFLTKWLLTFTVFGYAVPGFVVAILLIYIFSFQLKWLPSMGMGSAASYVLPVLALSINPIAEIARYVRNSFMDVLDQDYIRTARAKGLGDRLVIYKHALRNTLVPMVTIIGILVIQILSGSLFIEAIFSWPGMGYRLIESVMNKDFQVLQFSVLCYSAVVITVFFFVDILYGIIDPRIRKEH